MRGLAHRLSGRPARRNIRTPALDAAGLALVILAAAVGIALVLIAATVFIQGLP